MRLYAITDRQLLPGKHQAGRLTAGAPGMVRLAGEWAVRGWSMCSCGKRTWVCRNSQIWLERCWRQCGIALEYRGPGRQPRLLVNAGAAGAAEAVRAVGAAGIHLPGRWHAEQAGRARISGVVSVGCHSVGEVAVAGDGGGGYGAAVSGFWDGEPSRGAAAGAGGAGGGLPDGGEDAGVRVGWNEWERMRHFVHRGGRDWRGGNTDGFWAKAGKLCTRKKHPAELCGGASTQI